MLLVTWKMQRNSSFRKNQSFRGICFSECTKKAKQPPAQLSDRLQKRQDNTSALNCRTLWWSTLHPEQWTIITEAVNTRWRTQPSIQIPSFWQLSKKDSKTGYIDARGVGLVISVRVRFLHYRKNCFWNLDRTCCIKYGSHNGPKRILYGIKFKYCRNIWSSRLWKLQYYCDLALALSLRQNSSDLIRSVRVRCLVSFPLSVALAPPSVEAVYSINFTILAVTSGVRVLFTSSHRSNDSSTLMMPLKAGWLTSVTTSMILDGRSWDCVDIATWTVLWR